jgi:cell division septum initiation protein DivIVA
MEPSIPDAHSSAGGRNDRPKGGAAVPISEREIGQLFVEAQRFTDDALAKLEGQVERVLAEAGRKAAEIVLEAREEADELLRRARESVSLSSAKADELHDAVARLGTLVDSLADSMKSKAVPDSSAGRNPQ